tara:strand:+ start:150 stop:740 length:591 start_codon:yes stop_codon:yes gene_type:complete
MRGMFDFVVKPFNGRNNNTKKINDTNLLLNTELQNHNYVNRVGVIECVPFENTSNLKKGDKVILHHNVFRRFRDIRGQEKNSKSYYNEDLYFVSPDQIYAYNRDNVWNALSGFNFIKPIKEDKMFSINFEKPLIGILKYKDPSLKVMTVGDLVGFRPSSEYEFIIDNERLYRVPTKFITIKYEYQGDEEEYNPSWA